MSPHIPLAHLTSLAAVAALLATPLWAADVQQRDAPPPHSVASPLSSPQSRAARGFDHRMQVIAHDTPASAPAHGWRYFTDPAAPRAVVISPQGDYYFSRGKGLRWVAAQQD